MANLAYLIIVSVFILYYLLILLFEKKLLSDPKNIIEKFLAVLLTYVGVSLIYFSFTGKPFIGDDINSYYVYIFVIGFISVIWAIPNLLSEFRLFKKFIKKKK